VIREPEMGTKRAPTWSFVGLVLTLSFASSFACSAPTELILVVDTNLRPSDIDDVKVSIAGVPEVDVPLNQQGGPTFPLTLGLRPSGANRSVHVDVVAYYQGTRVVSQHADTTFVDGALKMLRILLLDTCIGLTCPSSPTQQTCKDGSCTSAEVAMSLLPDWPGQPPPRPPPGQTLAIDGHTLWADGWHSCANQGAVLYCWGQNFDGQIGDGSTVTAKLPRAVKGLNPNEMHTIGLGELTSCACDSTGQAWCWGRNLEGELGLGKASSNSQVPVPVPGLADCVQISGGHFHTCAVHADGTVSCWGSNSSGQLGLGSSTSIGNCADSNGSNMPCATAPAVVPGLTDVVEVRAGEEHTCARKSDKTVVCWGLNYDGELGDGTKTNRSSPVPVGGLDPDVTAISCGRWFTCGLHAAGTISCWGANDHGQLGRTTSDTTRPGLVANITDAIQVESGNKHACAVTASGRVWCWGGNMYGQLGDGTTTDSMVPINPSGLGTLNNIAVGAEHSCARGGSGPVYCWGQNAVNQLGDTTITDRHTPVTVAGLM
jgi:alpha-tubulin suppressor-like RCC1 family protein